MALWLVMAAMLFTPVKESAPAPRWVSVPEPEIALATVRALERLKTSVPLLATAPAPSLPVVPPPPTCSVVALSMVVEPV